VSVVLATVWFVRGGRTGDWRGSYERYRANLGRGILLGLELLVGADIIGTITAPLSFTSVGLLALIIIIRTFLSFSLETEIEGCWPWQRRSAEGNGSQRTGQSGKLARKAASQCSGSLAAATQLTAACGRLTVLS